MNFRVAAFCAAMGLVSSCAPTPVRLPSGVTAAETATVYFYSGKDIETSSLSVDGTTQGAFSMGLAVLPGEHSAYCEIQFQNEECVWDNRLCAEVTSYGHCKAEFRTEAGRSYAIRISKVGDSAFVSVEDEASGERAGHGSCTIDRSVSSTSRAEVRWRR